MKIKHLFIAMCGLLMISLASCSGNETPVSYDKVPAQVKEFLGKYFAGEKVQSVKQDIMDTPTEYELLLGNGTKVEINADGSWTEISNNTQAVPTDMLPDSAKIYLKANYADAKIVKLENEKKGYEVKLSNGTELKFDPQGSFIKIDK